MSTTTSTTISTEPAPHRLPRFVVAACEIFIGVGAVFGGYELLTDAEGFGLPESWLDGSPFPDYRIPGLFLFSILGLGMLAAALVTIFHARWWSPVALGMGTILAAWLVIETVIMGYRGSKQIVLVVVCGIPALALLLAGWRAGGWRELRGLLS